MYLIVTINSPRVNKSVFRVNKSVFGKKEKWEEREGVKGLMDGFTVGCLFD